MRLDELLEAGTYATNVEVQESSLHERSQIAQSLWYLRGDLSEQARNQGVLSFLDAFHGGGFPDETSRIAQALTDPLNQEQLRQALSAFIQEYRQNPELLRFRYLCIFAGTILYSPSSVINPVLGFTPTAKLA